MLRVTFWLDLAWNVYSEDSWNKYKPFLTFTYYTVASMPGFRIAFLGEQQPYLTPVPYSSQEMRE